MSLPSRISMIAAAIVLLGGLANAAPPALVTTIALGPQPPFVFGQQMAVNPATNRVYILSGSTSPVVTLGPSIAIVNSSTASFVGTLQLPVASSMSLVAMTETRNAVKGFAVNPATNRIYVAYTGASSGTVAAIDSTTDTVAASAPIPASIANIAINPTTNKLYVLETSGLSAQILVLDGNTLAQTAVISGVESGPMAINSANNKIYAAVPGPAFGVAVIDGSRDAVTAVVSLPVDTYDLIVNPVTNHVYAKPNATAGSPDFAIYKIDGNLDQLSATISSPFAPALGFSPNFTFVNSIANRIYSGLAIDGATNAVSTGLPAFQFTLASTPPLTCQFVQGLVVDFEIGNMYAGCDGDLVVADASTGAIKALVPVNYVINWSQLAVNPSNHAVYGMNANSVAILDPVALTASLVQMGNLAGGVAANPVTNQVYVTDESSSAAVTVNGATNGVIAKTFAQIGGMINSAFQPEAPQAIAVNKTKNQYIIAGNESGMVFDGATNAPLVPIRPQLIKSGSLVPLGFTFMSVNETTNKMYSTDHSNVYVTDLSTGAVSILATPFLKAGEICTVRGLAINAAQNWAYASSNCQLASPVLFVFDGSTGAMLQAVDLGGSIPIGSNVGDVLLNAKSNKLYITNYGGFSTATSTPIPPSTEVFNAATFAHLASISSVAGPMAVDTVLNAIYGISNSVPASGGGNVGAVIDGNTDTLSSTFPLGFVVSSIQPTPIAVNETTAMVYYVNGGAGTASVFQGNLPSPGTFSISGQLTGSGAAGVTIAAHGGVTVTTVTNSAGAFTLAGLPPGAYTVGPSTAGLFYSPLSQSVNITTANITGVNFAALSTPIAVTGLSLAPWTTIGPGVTTTGTVTLNQPAPAGGIALNLSATNTKPAKFPATVTVPAGGSSATFSVQGNSVGAVTSTTITATYTGTLAAQPSSASVNLTISPTDSLKIQSATWSKSTQLLSVSATSTNPQSILQLFLASNNQLLGTFASQGNGSYSIQASFTSGTPASVNVKSNLGGSTGQGVTVVP